MTWDRGKERIQKLIDDGELQLVEPSDELARFLIGEAAGHINSAKEIASKDFTGAYQLAYDGARKACASLLAPQGLRATQYGGHVAIETAVKEQFSGRRGAQSFLAFGRMRRTRNQLEYPGNGPWSADEGDVSDAIVSAEAILTDAHRILARNVLTQFFQV